MKKILKEEKIGILLLISIIIVLGICIYETKNIQETRTNNSLVNDSEDIDVKIKELQELGYSEKKGVESYHITGTSMMGDREYTYYSKEIKIDENDLKLDIRGYYINEVENIENFIGNEVRDSFTYYYKELYKDEICNLGYVQKKHIELEDKKVYRKYISIYTFGDKYLKITCDASLPINKVNKSENLYSELERKLVNELNFLRTSNFIEMSNVLSSEKIDTSYRQLHFILGKNKLVKNTKEVETKIRKIYNEFLKLVPNKVFNPGICSIVYENRVDSLSYGSWIEGNIEIDNKDVVFVNYYELVDKEVTDSLYTQLTKNNNGGYKHIIDKETENSIAFYLDSENGKTNLNANYTFYYRKGNSILKFSCSEIKCNTIEERNQKINNIKEVIDDYFEKLKVII